MAVCVVPCGMCSCQVRGCPVWKPWESLQDLNLRLLVSRYMYLSWVNTPLPTSIAHALLLWLICQWSVKVTIFPHTSTSPFWTVYACIVAAGVASTTWYMLSDCDRWSVANLLLPNPQKSVILILLLRCTITKQWIGDSTLQVLLYSVHVWVLQCEVP